jgi:rubrerythrin
MPNTALDTLKEAILLERRGYAFYRQVAAQTSHEAVREFFETMAAEELQHMQVLSEQYKSVASGGGIAALDPRRTDGKPLADVVLNAELKQRIAAADFEAAAISAAVLMEERAIAVYGARAEASADPDEKALFEWLVRWEQGHLSFLAGLDREIKERIWNDQQFWPF